MALCGLACKEGLLRVSMILLLKLRFKCLYNFFIENIIDRYGIDIQWIKNFRRPEWIFV